MSFLDSLDSFDPLVWATLGTWVLVIATIVLVYWQTRQTYRLHSANAVLELRERFDAPRMRQARRRLSQHLLGRDSADISNAEVASFFELVGALVHGGMLNERIVWNAFGSWITTYYWGLRHPTDRIGQIRERLHDPLVFFEFEWLNDRVQRMDRGMLGPAAYSALPPPDLESTALLEREAGLEE
jgi:hypothetical protein